MRCATKMAGHPSAVVMLTADAFGILPPIARLTRDQALFYFLSGFTAKLAGTEIGVKEPQPTFSTCFGAPFLPQPPAVYARMLGEKLDEHGSTVWLVNTGWTGGPYGEGHRMPIQATRRLLHAALSGELDGVEYRADDVFGFDVPVEVPGVETLAPRSALDLARPGRLRREGARAGRDVHGELREVRRRRRRGGHGRRPARLTGPGDRAGRAGASMTVAARDRAADPGGIAVGSVAMEAFLRRPRRRRRVRRYARGHRGARSGRATSA